METPRNQRGWLAQIRLISAGSAGKISTVRTIYRTATLAALAAVAGFAPAARADKFLFSGEHAIRFTQNGVIKDVVASGIGVALTNGGGGGSALNTIELTRPF